MAASSRQRLSQDSITVLKKTKKGGEKLIEVADKIKSFYLDEQDGNTLLKITLPAGSTENINPELFLGKFFEENEQYCCYRVNRTAIYDTEEKLFV